MWDKQNRQKETEGINSDNGEKKLPNNEVLNPWNRQKVFWKKKNQEKGKIVIKTKQKLV